MTILSRTRPIPRQLGIDLGTTNSVAALEGVSIPLAVESGRTTLPSAVSFLPNGQTRIGTAAKRRRSVDPMNTAVSAKRIIGRRWSDAATQQFRERYGFELCATEDGGVAFSTRVGPVTPSEIAGILLTNMLGQLTHELGDLERTVITVPQGFNEAQRAATRLAAEKAGLSDAHLIPEPLAAAYAYGHVANAVDRAAVYDLGGGTFDFSIVEWSEAGPRLLASEADIGIGGDDADRLLADWVVAQVLERHNWDLRAYTEVYMRLLAECERAKIRLCFFEETALDLGQVDPDCPVPFEGFVLSRAHLDPIVETIARRTFVACDSGMRKARMRPEDLEAVFLVGGSTYLHEVRESITAYFGRPGRYDLEPTEAVAIGASIAQQDDW